MRHQGRITTWKDERGFGFITPDCGGERVFVHISQFGDHNWRPVENAMVTYHFGMDDQGRLQALDVAIVGKRPRMASFMPVAAIVTVVAVAAGLLAVVAGLAAVGRLPLIVPLIYLPASAAAFLTYAWDKSQAGQNRWRVSERTLLLLGLIGGWPGALFAREMLRHKTKKRPFIAAFWLTAVLNCGILVGLLSPPGQVWVRQWAAMESSLFELLKAGIQEQSPPA